MKFGRQGIMILVLLGVLALILAIVSPTVFEAISALAHRQDQASTEWRLAAKGVVESKDAVEISSQLTGVIKKVLVDEGDRLQVGQPIILFSDEKMLAKLELAKAALRQTQANLAEIESGYRGEDIEAGQRVFERSQAILEDGRNEMLRMEKLFKTGAVTETARGKAKRDHDVALAEMREASANLKKLQRGPRKEEIASARADVDRARAELQFTQATLHDYTILSPINGLVIERSAEVGETVDVGTQLFSIIDPDNLHIWAELEETDTGKVILGQRVLVEVDAFPNQQFKGKVTQVFSAVQRKRQKSFDPVATFDINTQKIVIALDDYSGLVHGLTVTVLFNK